MPAGMQGQSNLDFATGLSALRILHLGVRNDVGDLTADAFTQNNPPVVTTAPSTTLTGITKKGILGGSVAICRPDIGNGKVGGPISSPGANNRTIGLFINDAVGYAFQNAPAAASNKAPYVSAMGAYGTRIYETLQQTTTGGGMVGDPLGTYYTGAFLYTSVNGFLTNRANDSIEVAASTTAKPIGVLMIVPSSTFPEMVFNLLV
jgi:hypothetical protein